MDGRRARVKQLARSVSRKINDGTLTPDDEEFEELVRLAQELSLEQARA